MITEEYCEVGFRRGDALSSGMVLVMLCLVLHMARCCAGLDNG